LASIFALEELFDKNTHNVTSP